MRIEPYFNELQATTDENKTATDENEAHFRFVAERKKDVLRMGLNKL